jgi:hypothetical protein
MKRSSSDKKGRMMMEETVHVARIGVVIYELLNKYCKFITAEKTID